MKDGYEELLYYYLIVYCDTSITLKGVDLLNSWIFANIEYQDCTSCKNSFMHLNLNVLVSTWKTENVSDFKSFYPGQTIQTQRSLGKFESSPKALATNNFTILVVDGMYSKDFPITNYDAAESTILIFLSSYTHHLSINEAIY